MKITILAAMMLLCSSLFGQVHKIQDVVTDSNIFEVKVFSPDGIENLGAAQYRISYDPEMLSVISVSIAPQIAASYHINWQDHGGFFLVSYFKKVLGAIHIPANSDLIIITLEKVSTGTSILSFESPFTTLYGGNFVAMPLVPFENYWLPGTINILDDGAPFPIMSDDVEYYINTILPEQLLPAIQLLLNENYQNWLENLKPLN